MAKKIIENLISKDMIETSVPPKNLIEMTEKLIMEELIVEEKLNEEVRQLLKKYESEIQRGRLDYRKLFEMTKHKLIKERNIIL